MPDVTEPIRRLTKFLYRDECRGEGLPCKPIEDILSDAAALLEVATKFRIVSWPYPIFVVRRENGLWAASNGHSVLNQDNLWEYEPFSSNRSEDFLSRTRFSIQEALRRARTKVEMEMKEIEHERSERGRGEDHRSHDAGDM